MRSVLTLSQDVACSGERRNQGANAVEIDHPSGDEVPDRRDNRLGRELMDPNRTVVLSDDGNRPELGHDIAVEPLDVIDVPARGRLAVDDKCVEEARQRGHHQVLLAGRIFTICASARIRDVAHIGGAAGGSMNTPDCLQGFLTVAAGKRPIDNHRACREPFAGEHPLISRSGLKDLLRKPPDPIRDPGSRQAEEVLQRGTGRHRGLVVTAMLGHLCMADVVLVHDEEQALQRIVEVVVSDLRVRLEDHRITRQPEGRQDDVSSQDSEALASPTLRSLVAMQDREQRLPMDAVEDRVLVDDDRTALPGSGNVVGVATGVDDKELPALDARAHVPRHPLDGHGGVAVLARMLLGHGHDGPEPVLARRQALGGAVRNLSMRRIPVTGIDKGLQSPIRGGLVGLSGTIGLRNKMKCSHGRLLSAL